MRLIYFSPVPFGSFRQRPHALVDFLSRNGVTETIWIEPYPTRLPQWTDLRTGNTRPAFANGISNVKVVPVRAIPAEPWVVGRWLNKRWLFGDLQESLSGMAQDELVVGIGKPSELALDFLSRNPGVVSFYDMMDDFPHFYTGISRAHMAKTETGICRRVDHVIASSDYLVEKAKRITGNVELVLNACDAPPDTVSRAAEPDVYGYIGTIGKWFDWGLVTNFANSVRESPVDIIGPVHQPPARSLPDNVRLLPPCPHTEVWHHMSRFRAGLIPFQANALTRSVDPIKFYEYTAMGLPVLSSSFGQMRDRVGQGHVADMGTSGSREIRSLQKVVARSGFRTAFLSENTWQARFGRSTTISRLTESR